MKILFYGETPCNETGAARVNRHLLDTIVDMGIEVAVLGTSHFFEDQYDHERYPYVIHHITGDTQVETHTNAGKAIEERAGTFDALFISGDMHVPQIMVEQVRKYPTIVLAAIDGPVLFPDQVSSLEVAAHPAVYSRYAYEQVLGVCPGIKDKFHCTPLGCEPDVFFPISREERQEYRRRVFGIEDDTFLVMWANRNQMRKDPGRAMKAFHLFHERVPNSRLYMHCRMEDVGGNVVSQARMLGLQVKGSNPEVMFSPPEYTEVAGFDRDKLNKMYNAADVCISTSQGEGWGLTTTEAMAAGTPFIGPANTSFLEILGSPGGYYFRDAERGYLVDSGGPNLWTIYYGRDDAPRPITSVKEMADTLENVYFHRRFAKELAQAARTWTEQHTWDVFKQQWKEILCNVEHSLPALPGKMVAI